MKKKWFDLKRGFGAAVLVLALCMMMGLATAQAAPDKTRGRLNVDVSDFTLVHSTTSDTSKYGFAPEDDTGGRYRLYYKNSFTDRNNLGCTYRSNSKYDLTDVTAIELYGFFYQTRDDKVLFYVDSDPNTYYHTTDDRDLSDETVKGNGTVRYMSDFTINMFFDIQHEQAKINQRYSEEYVFLGLSHAWGVHEAEFFVDNKTIASDGSQGCMNLVLKKHTIGLLEPQKLTHVVVDEDGKSSEPEYNAFSNVKMGLENGHQYLPGETGDIYRDETVTLTYSLSQEKACALKSFKFYGDKEKKNFLYEMDVTAQDEECTFTLSSSLIRTLEEKAGKYQLGDIYVEPVFGTQEITTEFSNVVAEAKDDLEVALSKTNDDGSKEYVLREKTGSGETLGTFYMNQAHQVGDELAIDFVRNEQYTGDYAFSYYEYRMCQNSNQLNGADQIIVQPSEEKTDILENISNDERYFWVRAHAKLQAEITLEDKQTTFNNKEVQIEEAAVTWPEGHQQPTGKITYHYYTDEACKNELAAGELPVDAGTYYVKATLAQDDYYEAAVSNVATLVINKATPVLKNLKGAAEITYGDTLGATEPVGKALGVTEQSIDGIFAWKDPAQRPSAAGIATAEVIFTPSELLAKNYTTATGTARVTVNKATPTITADPFTKVFDGEAVKSIPAAVTGVDGEETGQTLVYEFYSKVGEQYVKMLQPPVNAGTYYARVYTASSNANYSYAETDLMEVTILQRECELIPVPINESDAQANKYSVYVYVTNTVKEYAPQGKIKLVLDPKSSWNIGDYREMSAAIEEQDGRCFAYFYIPGTPSSGFNLTVSYLPESPDNYKITRNTLDVFDGSELNHTKVELTYGGAPQSFTAEDAFAAISSCDNVSTTWLNLSDVSARDVVDVAETGERGTVTITPENAGTETLVAYVKGTTETAEKSWYLFYDITVSPAEVNVSLADKTVTYSGNPAEADAAQVTCEKYGAADPVAVGIPVSYTYYSDEGLSAALCAAPTDAGAYYVLAATEAQRNYRAGQSVSRLTVSPAEPEIVITDKTVTFDGQAHTLDAAVIMGIDGIARDSAEASQLEDQRRLPAGSVLYRYDCPQIDYHSTEAPVHAGRYTVTEIYTPGEADNYAQPEAHQKTAVLTIEPAACVMELDPMEMVYTGEPAEPNTLYFTGVDGKKEEVRLEKAEGDSWKDSRGNEYVFMYTLSTEMSYSAEAPSDAGLYYVYAVKSADGDYKRALSNRAVLLIRPADTHVTLKDAETTYTGEAADQAALSPATVTNQKNEDITESVAVTYRYYADENAAISIGAPTDAGTYYVQAFVKSHPNYNAGQSGVQKLTINKATPELSDLHAGDIVYGTEAGASVLSGSAAGVKGESLNGTFAWAEAIRHEKRDAGSYDLAVVFLPDEAAARNYTEAYGRAGLEVTPFTPQLKGADRTVVYNGAAQRLDPVGIDGAEGMPEPTGTLTDTYYADPACTIPVSTAEVKDAGTYYCKVDFASDTGNYTNAAQTYRLEIGRKDAVIAPEVSTLGKDAASGTVEVRGALVGVFDDPTGTVTVYRKPHGAPDSEYVQAAADLAVRELDGNYLFEAEIGITQGRYDFKAVYNEGAKRNYNIADGVLEDVDMSKIPQDIYFKDKLIVKEYGADDFVLEVVDEQNGPEKVTYHLVTEAGDANAVAVSAEGTVQIRDTGRAFVMAVKPGNEHYSAAYAFAEIQVTQAPTEIRLADKTVTYTGRPAEIDQAVLTSHGRPIAEEEEISVVYTYEHVQTGALLDAEPVEAGVYRVSAYSCENDHYLASEQNAVCTLTIQKAQAKIVLETDHADQTNKILTLRGYLPGVFDQPGGTITLYYKVSGQPDDEYAVAAERVSIRPIGAGSYGFFADAAVELNKTYDFKAVYQAGDVENYLIADGLLTNVGIKEVIDDEQDDEKTNGSNNGKDRNDAVDTGDAQPVFGYLLLMIAAAAVLIKLRKYAGR